MHFKFMNCPVWTKITCCVYRWADSAASHYWNSLSFFLGSEPLKDHANLFSVTHVASMPYDGKCLIDSLGHILNKLLKDEIWRVLFPQGKHCCTKSMVEEAEKSHQNFKQQRKNTKTAKLERNLFNLWLSLWCKCFEFNFDFWLKLKV